MKQHVTVPWEWYKTSPSYFYILLLDEFWWHVQAEDHLWVLCVFSWSERALISMRLSKRLFCLQQEVFSRVSLGLTILKSISLKLQTLTFIPCVWNKIKYCSVTQSSSRSFLLHLHRTSLFTFPLKQTTLLDKIAGKFCLTQVLNLFSI